jgi:hypothetical protein
VPLKVAVLPEATTLVDVRSGIPEPFVTIPRSNRRHAVGRRIAAPFVYIFDPLRGIICFTSQPTLELPCHQFRLSNQI